MEKDRVMWYGKWYVKLALSVLTGLLLSFSWYPHGLALLSLLALAPLLWLSDISLKEGRRNAFGRGILLFYPAFFVFNLITTYWIAYCTVPGAAAAVVANALLQTLTFSAWHACRKQVPNRTLQAVMLVSFWCAFEYLHLNWDLTWPWLSLGNVFAANPELVQWYSVTGAFGGTVWILVSNFLVYGGLRATAEKDRRRRRICDLTFAALFVGLLAVSFVMLRHAGSRTDRTTPIEAVIVQQNTDPWDEEYYLTNAQEAERILAVAQPYMNERVRLVITPESSIAHPIDLTTLRRRTFDGQDARYAGFLLIDSALHQYPNANYVLGLSTFQAFDHKTRATAHEVMPGIFMESYNTAGFYNRNHLESYYHKCRLVPGVEKMPFPKVLGFLGDALVKLGGSNTSLSSDTEQRTFAFEADGKTLRLGTGICYESVYGELMGNFVKNGADVLAVITNDSWWGDSQGHGQHFEMSRLRAVETRRYVLRAANGGFSGVIDPTGKVLEKTDYGERTALHAKVYAQGGETFYVKHGDYIARTAVALTFAALLFCIIAAIVRRP